MFNKRVHLSVKRILM